MPGHSSGTATTNRSRITEPAPSPKELQHHPPPPNLLHPLHNEPEHARTQMTNQTQLVNSCRVPRACERRPPHPIAACEMSGFPSVPNLHAPSPLCSLVPVCDGRWAESRTGDRAGSGTKEIRRRQKCALVLHENLARMLGCWRVCVFVSVCAIDLCAHAIRIRFVCVCVFVFVVLVGVN